MRRAALGLIVLGFLWRTPAAAEAPGTAIIHGPPLLPAVQVARQTAERLNAAQVESSALRRVAEARAAVLVATQGTAPPALAAVVAEEAVRAGVDPLMLAAIAELESRWDPAARGTSGELGLMQIQPATARGVARAQGWPLPADADLLQPRTNARLAAAYLVHLRELFPGDSAAVLTAYNRGPSGAREYRQRNGHYRSEYAAAVLGLQAAMERRIRCGNC